MQAEEASGSRCALLQPPDCVGVSDMPGTTSVLHSTTLIADSRSYADGETCASTAHDPLREALLNSREQACAAAEPGCSSTCGEPPHAASGRQSGYYGLRSVLQARQDFDTQYAQYLHVKLCAGTLSGVLAFCASRICTQWKGDTCNLCSLKVQNVTSLEMAPKYAISVCVCDASTLCH